MKPRILIIAVTVVLFSVISLSQAKGGERRKPKQTRQNMQAAQAGSQEEQKQALVNNSTLLRNQELRVVILQQLLKEETVKMNNLQEQFCRLYNLDLQKFRQGLYRYDEAQGRFIELQPQQQAR